MYQNEIGVKQDYKKALNYMKKAAKKGNPIAQNNLGNMYQYGEGRQQDYKKAIGVVRKIFKTRL